LARVGFSRGLPHGTRERQAGEMVAPRRTADRALRIDAEEQDQGNDHELGVEQDENAGVVEAPFSAETACGFDHAPCGGDGYEELPG